MKILTVSELNSQVAMCLKSSFSMPFLLKGEISNFVAHRSGHYYFTLKDDRSEVKAVFFSASKYLNFMPKDGQEVEVTAQVTLYEPRGSYQIRVMSMKPAGLGVLYQRFLDLKANLSKKGLFDQAHKKPIPRVSQSIGIITSAQAAGFKDVLKTLKEQAPYLNITLYPSAVQGHHASGDLVKALSYADRGDHDVLLMVRGGGSLEDMWCFNDEALIYAMFDSKTPIVTGIGHEIDETLADYVADYKAHTPTAAAQLVGTDRDVLLYELEQISHALKQGMQDNIQWKRMNLQMKSMEMPDLHHRVLWERQKIKGLRTSLDGYIGGIKTQIDLTLDTSLRHLNQAFMMNALRFEHQINHHRHLLQTQMRQYLDEKKTLLQKERRYLNALSPKAIMNRGFSLVYDEQGQLLKSIHDIHEKDILQIEFSDGMQKVKPIS
ncbi:MAG: exodeoxyribonuclease VII large subunit [Alcaligenaceae bacterium]|nr:exodeoxyribonuclease VII large subunit [Alcaligenaceae bacterium]